MGLLQGVAVLEASLRRRLTTTAARDHSPGPGNSEGQCQLPQVKEESQTGATTLRPCPGARPLLELCLAVLAMLALALGRLLQERQPQHPWMFDRINSDQLAPCRQLMESQLHGATLLELPAALEEQD